MVVGVLFFKMGFRRRVRFDPHVTIIRGILTIRKKRVPSNAGLFRYVNEYYVGNVLLYGPPGSYYLLEKLGGHVIQVHALFMHIYPPLTMTNMTKRYQGIEDGLLLNLDDHINLSRALEKYGHDVFKRAAWRFNFLSTPPMLICIGLAFYLIVKYEIFAFWAFMGIIVAAVIGAGVLYLIIEYLYKKLRKGLDSDYVDLTLEEILKG